jgi:hypothetical protein
VTDSASKPPLPIHKSPWPAVPTILLVVFTALVIGSVQEYRLRTAAPAQMTLEFAEHAFQGGDDQTALKLFSELANKNNPNAEHWLGQTRAGACCIDTLQTLNQPVVSRAIEAMDRPIKLAHGERVA